MWLHARNPATTPYIGTSHETDVDPEAGSLLVVSNWMERRDARAKNSSLQIAQFSMTFMLISVQSFVFALNECAHCVEFSQLKY